MFASKTPRDLNPHSVIMTGAGTPPLCTCGWQGRRFDGPILAEHIAEFDHAQHNEPNPILVEFREEWESTAFSELLHWWLPTLEENTYPGWTEPQIEHARRVLTRLIAVST